MMTVSAQCTKLHIIRFLLTSATKKCFITHHPDHTIPETCLRVQTAPLVVSVHVDWADVVLVQEELQHGPLQRVDCRLTLREVKVGKALIVIRDTYLPRNFGTATNNFDVRDAAESESYDMTGVGTN